MSFGQACLLVAAALFSGAALAQNHLVPKYADNSFVAQDYNRIVASVLKDAFADDVVVKAWIWNPLGAEEFVGVKKVGDEFRVFAVGSTERRFSYAEIDGAKHEGATEKEIAGWNVYLGPLRARPEDVPVQRCERRVDSGLAMTIISAFESMIAGTRPDVPRAAHAGQVETVVVDGTSYEFSNSAGAIGRAYVPSVTGQAANLIEIAGSIDKICQSGDPRERTRLNEKLNSLRSGGSG